MPITFYNYARGYLSQDETAGSTSLHLQSPHTDLPAPSNGDYYYITIVPPGTISWNAQPTRREICKVTAKTGNILTVERGVDSTTPTALSSGDVVEIRPNAKSFEDLRDLDGVFNVKQYGALGDNSTDDTVAIGRAIAAASSLIGSGYGATVYFPPGKYHTEGLHDITGLNGLVIKGAGVKSTTIIVRHATNDLFTVGNTNTYNINLEDFKVDTPAATGITRTTGYVLKVQSDYDSGVGLLLNSTIRDIEVEHQANGFWVAKGQYVFFRNIFFHNPSDAGVGIRIGQDVPNPPVAQFGEIHLDNCHMLGCEQLSGGVGALGTYGFIIRDGDAVYMTHCTTFGHVTSGMVIVAGDFIASNNHFFSQCIFDTTQNGPAVDLIAGAGGINRLQFSSCWFSSAGTIAPGGGDDGIGFRSVGLVNGVLLTGCNFIANNANGLYIDCNISGGGDFILTGSRVMGGGAGGSGATHVECVYVDGFLNSWAITCTGNVLRNAHAGVGLRTSASTDRVIVTGNNIYPAPVFGAIVTPMTQEGTTGNWNLLS